MPPLHDLVKLQAAWKKSRKVHGGTWALAGFDYQISLAILEIIRNFDREDRHVVIEEISDMLVQDDDGLVVTQVKRTLRSDNLQEALQELWGIDCFARAEFPSSANRIRYHIHSSRRMIIDSDRAISKWAPRETTHQSAEIAAFKQKLKCLTTLDPRLEAASLLTRDFRVGRPFAEHARFAGVLSRAAESLSFSQAVCEIMADLSGLRAAVARLERGFHLWSEKDRPPSTVCIEPDERNAVRIGERLTVLDLRQGRLADRAAFSALHEECELWLTEHHDLSRIPVFCIHGRSGSGKSAALLHLAARLHKEDPSRHIVWLGADVDCFAEAAYWVEEHLQMGASVIFAIDDPFKVRLEFERGVRVLQTIWQNLLLTADDKASAPLTMPVVICCSPTEQLEAAKDDCCEEVDISPAPLRKETADDYNELATWYKLRTGREPTRIKDSTLLVQCLFQWHKGDLQQFAHRFRRRLEGFDAGNSKLLFDAVSNILALGRLYVAFPWESLRSLFDQSPELEKAFAQLADEESHFDFATGSGQRRMGIRLAHPQLADTIYRTWFGRPSDRGLRRAHLHHGIRAYLNLAKVEPSRRNAPLWAFARAASKHATYGQEEAQTLQERISLIQPELSELLPSVYSELCQTTIDLVSDLPVWMDLDNAFQLGLQPSPEERAVACVRRAVGPIQGLRLACHKLLEYRQAQPSNVEVVSELLQRSSFWREPDGRIWQDWFPLALEFVNKVGAGQILSSLSAVVVAHPRSRFVAPMLSLLLQQGGSAFTEPVWLWLNVMPTGFRGWSATLRDIYDRAGRSTAFDELALRFLSEQPDHGSWSFFWEFLWRGGVVLKSELQRRALIWLGISSGDKATAATTSSPYVKGIDQVWQKLWAKEATTSEERSALDAFARSWLERVDVSFDGWRYVWQDLWDAHQTAGQRASLVNEGYRWLSLINPDHPSWGRMWTLLWNEPTAGMLRADLARLGRRWLQSVNEIERSWGFVWTSLWDEPAVGKCRAELAFDGHRWLRSVDANHGSWSHVWIRLWKTTGSPVNRSQLAKLGRQWLYSVSLNHVGWKRVGGLLWARTKDKMDIEELARWGHRWLLSNPKHEGWTYAWKALWDKPAVGVSRAELAKEGRQWLTINSSRDSARFIRSALRQSVSD